MSSEDPAKMYQDLLLAHASSPAHRGPLGGVHRVLHGVNPLCGDEIDLYVGGTQDELVATFESRGCALCRASASIMLETVNGVARDVATAEVRRFIAHFLAPRLDAAAAAMSAGVRALLDLRAFPARTRCVLLPWETLAGGPG